MGYFRKRAHNDGRYSLEEILQQVHSVILETERLRRMLYRGEECADSILQFLKALHNQLVDISKGAPQDSLPGAKPFGLPTRPKPEEAPFLLETLAQDGVDILLIRELANGAALVQVNGKKAFKLPPTLAHMLAVIAEDSTHSDSTLVGWKSRDEVASVLQKKVGRHFAKHTITQLVARLRKSLIKKGQNPFLVQTHRQFGIRFAVKKKPST